VLSKEARARSPSQTLISCNEHCASHHVAKIAFSHNITTASQPLQFRVYILCQEQKSSINTMQERLQEDDKS
jgi:hypothetical protein